ncbi:hypothetical protein GCM10009715_24800 [Paeniglutamicibacter psychrophenolicus]|uniref:Uncharacterized protein n=1 Tax=Paeniglutamicibacter psychrophenolicus TaxID=257454 RepID=A0ABS4WE67_9MICC|nr:hypothetical protein [Paeniglutamicibacter psychrophenolicus]MBP2374433.1 hypothetical protein [Paeniglutamicibacter psychrophenolicus]
MPTLLFHRFQRSSIHHGNEQFKVIAGFYTHADTRHVALMSDCGKRLGERKLLAVGSGYLEIAAYMTIFVPITAVGD